MCKENICRERQIDVYVKSTEEGNKKTERSTDADKVK